MNKLNLGCGANWKKDHPDYDGLDINNYGQKYVCDVLLFEPEIQYDEIMANHFLEHFNQDEVKKIIRMVWESLKVGGKFRFVVPHIDKDRSWVLTHKTFWNEKTIGWLGEKDADEVYGFGRWEVVELIVNERKDIHSLLIKRK